jgi:hypothetical protein
MAAEPKFTLEVKRHPETGRIVRVLAKTVTPVAGWGEVKTIELPITGLVFQQSASDRGSLALTFDERHVKFSEVEE